MMNNLLLPISLNYIVICSGYSVIHRHRLTVSWWEWSVRLVNFEPHFETTE